MLNKKKKEYALVFLDFSKAFDLINHQVLFERMSHHGISRPAIKLLKSYLARRKQYVEIDGDKSDMQVLGNIGCPQGSCLGPLLYLIYTIEMANIPGNHKAIFFADDTCLIIEKTNSKISFKEEVENTLGEFVDWISANKLKLNESKSVIYVKNSKLKSPIKLGTVEVEITDNKKSSKYLGIWMNGNLDWKEHANTVIKKLAKAKGAIHRAKSYLSTKSLRLLYSAFF